MLIDCFRGLGTSLVEGCAGDFRPNATECDRVHPSARQRASGACQSAQAEPWPIAPYPRSIGSQDKFRERSAKFRDRSPGFTVDLRN